MLIQSKRLFIALHIVEIPHSFSTPKTSESWKNLPCLCKAVGSPTPIKPPPLYTNFLTSVRIFAVRGLVFSSFYKAFRSNYVAVRIVETEKGRRISLANVK